MESIIEDFSALAGSGLLSVTAQNTGGITADYSVINDNENITETVTLKLLLHPLIHSSGINTSLYRRYYLCVPKDNDP